MTLTLMLLLIVSTLTIIIFNGNCVHGGGENESPRIVSTSSTRRVTRQVVSRASLTNIMGLRGRRINGCCNIPITVVRGSTMCGDSSTLSTSRITIFEIDDRTRGGVTTSTISNELSSYHDSCSALDSSRGEGVSGYLIRMDNSCIVVIVYNSRNGTSRTVSRFCGWEVWVRGRA